MLKICNLREDIALNCARWGDRIHVAAHLGGTLCFDGVDESMKYLLQAFHQNSLKHGHL